MSSWTSQAPQFKNRSGFTLLEVVLSLGIMMTLAIFATQVVRHGLDMRTALSDQARWNQGLNLALGRIVNDIENTLLILNMNKSPEYKPIDRATATLFRTKLENKSHELYLTTLTHRPLKTKSYESNQTFVVYKVVPRKDKGEFTDLARGETPVIPQNFRDEVKTQIIAKNIKSLIISSWTGEKWDKDRWDSQSSDWRDRLPYMVMVEIEAWDVPENIPPENQSEYPLRKLQTIVFLPQATGINELKDRVKNISWY